MTDTSTRYYVYSHNVLKYSFGHQDATNTDTLFYSYDGQGRLVKTTSHTFDPPFEYSGRTDYLYNPAGQVICTEMRLDTSLAIQFSDSSVYTYENDNVTQITSYWMNGDELVSHTLHLSYDTKKNFYRAMNVPYVSYEYWSKNNITEIDGVSIGDQTVTVSYLAYNASGYPTKAVFLGSLNNNTSTLELFFECH